MTLSSKFGGNIFSDFCSLLKKIRKKTRGNISFFDNIEKKAVLNFNHSFVLHTPLTMWISIFGKIVKRRKWACCWVT